MTEPTIKVAILDDFEKISESVPAFQRLQSRMKVTILQKRLDTADELVAVLQDFDAVLLMRERTRFSGNEYRRLPRLKLISQTGRTTLHLDIPAANERGVTVAGTAGDNGMSTTELTVALMLSLLRKIPQVNQRMREERWPAIAGQTMAGKTVGVLGFGRIGKEVARIVKAFDRTRVLAHSRTLTPSRAAVIARLVYCCDHVRETLLYSH